MNTAVFVGSVYLLDREILVHVCEVARDGLTASVGRFDKDGPIPDKTESVSRERLSAPCVCHWCDEEFDEEDLEIFEGNLNCTDCKENALCERAHEEYERIYDPSI
jgi:hypothetical protein